MDSAIVPSRPWTSDLLDHPSCRFLVDLIPDAAWILDRNGAIIYLNKQCFLYTGIQSAEALRRSWHELIPQEDLERLFQGWANSPVDLPVYRGLVKIRNVSGYRENFVKIATIPSATGEILGWFGTCTDVQDLVDCDGSVDGLVESLRKEVRLREESQAIMAHELRNPLTALNAQFQLLNRFLISSGLRSAVPENILSTFQKADGEIKRISRIIDELFDFSLIGSGQLSLNLHRWDLAELVREVMEKLLPQARVAGCILDFFGGSEVIGSWDRFRIEQVLSNLLSNAIKYAPGEPIRIGIRTSGNQAVVEIQDHGKGIDPEDQARVFRPFQRLKSARQKAGLGLGLFIASQIAQAHRGTLRLESEPGQGCRFILILPF